MKRDIANFRLLESYSINNLIEIPTLYFMSTLGLAVLNVLSNYFEISTKLYINSVYTFENICSGFLNKWRMLFAARTR